MLLEVPNMAAADVDENRRTRVISRTFRKYHDIYDRQVFTGPPEQTRDYVMTATKVGHTGESILFHLV
jgi:translation initiation factor 3 subunit C